MMIDLKKVMDEYGIIPKGVIQVGAHWAEEHDDYVKWGVKKFVYIEPCKDTFITMFTKFDKMDVDEFKKMPNGVCVELQNGMIFMNLACGEKSGEMAMYVSKQNQGQSNSFLKSKLHSIQHPEILFTETEMVKVVPLDSLHINKEDYNILVTDCEGYDGEVIKGAKETLKNIDLVYSEVNRGETREGNMLIDEFEELLWQEGFVKVEEFWPSPAWTWGDAVFIRKSFIHA